MRNCLIKHIFSDLDGTLLDSNGNLAPKNIQLIQSSDLPFTLISGHSPVEMKPVIDALGLVDPQIAFNGGLIFQFDGFKVETLDESPLTLNWPINLLP